MRGQLFNVYETKKMSMELRQHLYVSSIRQCACGVNSKQCVENKGEFYNWLFPEYVVVNLNLKYIFNFKSL